MEDELSDGAGGGSAAGNPVLTPPAESDDLDRGRRRRRKLILVWLIAFTFLIAGVLGFYLTMRQPLTELMPDMLGIGRPHYLFSMSGLSGPSAVAVTSNGDRVYVTDGGNERVTRIFNRDGNLLSVLVPPSEVAKDWTPTYVAVDGRGKVYVSDRKRFTIYVFNPDGSFSSEFRPNGKEDFGWTPLGVAVDSRDNLYVTDVIRGRHEVLGFDASGRVTLQFGQKGKGDNDFDYPNGLAVDAKGRIYIADSNNSRVMVYDSAGKRLGGFNQGGKTGPIGLPRGLAVDEERLYVVDTFGHRVLVFDTEDSGKLLFTFGEFGSGSGQFSFPNGIAVDSRGRVYVADRGNDRVQVWSY